MKILIITGKLQNYRVPVFNRIVERSSIDLTVAHSSKKMNDGSFLFKEVILNEIKIGPFTVHKGNLKKYCNQFDIVVPTFYLQKISFMSLLFGKRKYKLAFWGIGVKASQTSKFDEPTMLNSIRFWIANKSDAMIFYTDYARNKYIQNNVDKNKLFVMNNTVFVDNNLVNIDHTKTSIVFIGTINRSKRIFELLNAYKDVLDINNRIPALEIIGGGEQLQEVQDWVKLNNLEYKIFVKGPIYDLIEKSKILNRAICVISPAQAGLSVLEAMGYGVPFITHKDAITGGERLNINVDNGVLFNSYSDLKDILLDISSNPLKYIDKGKSALEYYNNYRTYDHMVNGFLNTVEFLKNTK